MNKPLKYSGAVVLFILSSTAAAVIKTLIDAWMKGESLARLNNLGGFYGAVVKSTVPAWLFAPVFVLAMVSLFYAIRFSPARKPRGRVHFVPDGRNSYWSKRSDSEMSVAIGGTFTFDGPETLKVFQASLKGTAPARFDMNLQTANGRVTTPEFWLDHNAPQTGTLYLRLSPVIGTPGKSLRCAVILHDSRNRDFSVGPVELPYRGG